MDKDFISFGAPDKKYHSYSITNFFTPTQKELPDDPIKKLTKELLNLYELLKPIKEEIEIREYLTNKIIKILDNLNFDSVIFGSYSMGLFLPTSDIDIIIKRKEAKGKKLKGFAVFELLENVKNELIREKVADNDEILNLSKGKIPLLRFVDSTFNIKVDISFSEDNPATNRVKSNFGIEHKSFIEIYLCKYPFIKIFIILLKQILKIRGLGDAKKGGLCSYAQLMLIINFINLHPLIQTDLIDPFENIGVLFMDFFQHFGVNYPINFTITEFGYRDRINDCQISIQDPFNSNNDLGINCTNSGAVLDVFTYLYRIMSLALKEKQSMHDSLLNLWVHVSDGESVWRERNYQKWKQMNL
ncbi:hypothetical protein H311_01980 [Anncaliia algerae PRA109]|nr:hypothetical protein H311_01980 [Anncaliia algerae PRA109]